MSVDNDLLQWLRARYRGWLEDDYRHERLVARSTDVDRVLMTAQCILAGAHMETMLGDSMKTSAFSCTILQSIRCACPGLFPPSGGQVWDPQLPWQPIPVHTVPLDQEYLLNKMHAFCPR